MRSSSGSSSRYTAEDGRQRLMLAEQRRELDQRVDVTLLGRPDLDTAVSDRGLVGKLPDAVDVLHAEADVEPGVGREASSPAGTIA